MDKTQWHASSSTVRPSVELRRGHRYGDCTMQCALSQDAVDAKGGTTLGRHASVPGHLGSHKYAWNPWPLTLVSTRSPTPRALATGTMLHDDHCRSWHPLCSTCPRATKMASAVVSGFHASATREKIRGWCRAQRLNPPSPIHPSNASRCPCRRPWPLHYGKCPRLCALDPHGSAFCHNVWNGEAAPTQNVGLQDHS